MTAARLALDYLRSLPPRTLLLLVVATGIAVGLVVEVAVNGGADVAPYLRALLDVVAQDAQP